MVQNLINNPKPDDDEDDTNKQHCAGKTFTVCVHPDCFVLVVSCQFLICIKKQVHCSCKTYTAGEITNFNFNSAVSTKMKFHSPLAETTKNQNYLHGWIHKRTAETQSSSSICKFSIVFNIVFTSTANGTRTSQMFFYTLVRPVGCSELINWTFALSSSCIKPGHWNETLAADASL